MAFDAFLKIDGITGDVTEKDQKGEIAVLSFSWGASQPGLATGAASRQSKPQVSDLTIVKRVDGASAKLLSQSCGGGTLPSAFLTVRIAADQEGTAEYLKIKLSDIMISSISAGGNTQTDQEPLEQVSLNFSKIEMSFTSAMGQTSEGSCSPSLQKGS